MPLNGRMTGDYFHVMSETAGHARWHRISSVLRREVTDLAIITAYLYVCFGALLLFKAAVLRAHGIEFALYGTAALKALVLGKFTLIGNDLQIGQRSTRKPLLYQLVYKVLVFSAFLLLLSVVEQAGLAALHGRPVTAELFSFSGGTWLEIAASCVLLVLIQIPYFGLALISGAVGAGVLARLFFGERVTGNSRTTERV